MTTRKKRPNDTGRRLTKALTREQIESLLDVVGPQTLLEKIDQGKKVSDKNMTDTVKAVLRSTDELSSEKKGSRRIASRSRTMQDWEGLWERWNAIVEEVGDEEGKYTIQDNHWEPPYFDGSSMAMDLEELAQKMLKEIDAVFGFVNDPDLFTKAIDEIDAAIKSYPEWMGVDQGEPCVLEFKTTCCVLKWLWLASNNESRPGTAFLKKMETIERTSSLVGLDSKAMIDFVTGCSEPVRREIYEELCGGRFKQEQQDAYSPWNAIVHQFERRYDKDKYLARCSSDLEKNWRLGKPLVDKAVAREDWEGAQQWLVNTFASYQNRGKEGTWFPESGLLIAEDRYPRENSEMAGASELLSTWSRVSEKLGNQDRAIAARFQAAVARDPEGLQQVIDEFNTLRQDEASKSLEKLFRQWQDEIARRSIESYHGEKGTIDTWIQWAITARVKGNDGFDIFRKKLDDWLSSLMNNKGEFAKQWRALGCLTVDLSNAKELRNRFPGLTATALRGFLREGSLDNSRASMIRSLCPRSTTDIVMDVWKKQFAQIVPDPAQTGGHYDEPVKWAKALLALNPDAYARLLKEWNAKHHRRRNLWEAIQKARLPKAMDSRS